MVSLYCIQGNCSGQLLGRAILIIILLDNTVYFHIVTRLSEREVDAEGLWGGSGEGIDFGKW